MDGEEFERKKKEETYNWEETKKSRNTFWSELSHGVAVAERYENRYPNLTEVNHLILQP